MRNLNVLVLALVAAPLLGGCYARARGSAYVYTPAPRAYVAPQPVYVQPAPPPQQVVYQDDVIYTAPPPQVESYPYVVYNGQAHYYVGGRWYRRGGNGWVVFNSEPGYLVTERTRRGWSVTTAPPAYGPSYGAPPPVYTPPPVYAPPPPPAYRPGYTVTTTTQAPPAYGGGGSVYVGGSSAPPAVRATTSAPPAH